VDELFSGERAELAKAHATRVAQAFQRRLADLNAQFDDRAASGGLRVTIRLPGAASPEPAPGE
jgi:hypothetical protein